MKCREILQEARACHGPDRGEVFLQDVNDAGFVVNVGLLHPCQISLEAIFALPAFYGLFHLGNVGGQFDTFSIAKPDIVVRFTFYQFDSFGIKRSVEIDERFFEKVRKQKQRRALVEPVTMVVYEAAPTACVVILLNDSDSKARLGQPGSAGNTACACACMEG